MDLDNGFIFKQGLARNAKSDFESISLANDSAYTKMVCCRISELSIVTGTRMVRRSNTNTINYKNAIT